MSLSLICNKQHKQYPGGCLACLYEENSALRAEVERQKAEVDRDRIEIENLRRWREIAEKLEEALRGSRQKLKVALCPVCDRDFSGQDCVCVE